MTCRRNPGGWVVPPPRCAHFTCCGFGLALVASLVVGCHDRSPVPPIPAPVVNLGDPKLKTVELSISEPSRGPSVIREKKNSRFNVSWLGPVQPSPPSEPKPFLVKIGRKRADGVFAQTESVLVLQAIGNEGVQARYRVVMNAPTAQGEYWLRLQNPGKVILDVQLLID